MKLYRTNKRLYIGLLVFAATVLVISLLFPGESRRFAIFVGIGSGMVASVLVAWLIDYANCRSNEKRNERFITTLFQQFDLSIQYCLNTILSTCAASNPSIDKEREYTIEEVSAFFAQSDSSARCWRYIYQNIVTTYLSVDATLLLAYEPVEFHSQLYDILNKLQCSGNTYNQILRNYSNYRDGNGGTIEHSSLQFDLERLRCLYDLRGIEVKVKYSDALVWKSDY